MLTWGSADVDESTAPSRLEEQPDISLGGDVETVDNHIYLYSDITKESCLDLAKALRNIENRLLSEQISRGFMGIEASPPIWLHIDSPGGVLYSALAISDRIQRMTVPVYSVIEGTCASAATIISCSCHKRYILPSSFVLIHQLSGITWGTFARMQDSMNLYGMAMKSLVRFYTRYTAIGEEEVKVLLERDSWFDAEEALARGLVDKII